MIVATQGRENITPEQIQMLNQLAWDTRHYANCKDRDGWFLEITYRQSDAQYRYRVDCPDEMQMHRLRAELDENTYLNDEGYSVGRR